MDAWAEWLAGINPEPTTCVAVFPCYQMLDRGPTEIEKQSAGWLRLQGIIWNMFIQAIAKA